VKRYNPKDIEPKWQQTWAENKLYEAKDDSQRPKKYILEYFPYPSGAAMHVGHVRNYTIGDTLSRHARMRGYNVLHPMGWDAFGLPAENYAIKTGISPQEAIKRNTTRFKEQLSQMGFGYDWSREFASSDPDYYRWTQWFFLLLHKRGLAYRKESLQWWCPVDKTVLANEQVENGVCWRCGSRVEKKALKQWFFKITDYADRLVDDLDELNWSDSIKNMQRNWIGRSRGAEVTFTVADSDQELRIFTTRPDTLYGATFMVLAPEHRLVDTITTDEHRARVGDYQKHTLSKSDVERQETNREKTGVFTGAYAINPVNDTKIPIWIADYVLAGYGTGAIMAVPAHDERDHEFAQKFDLPIIPVMTPFFFDAAEYDPKALERPTAIAIGYDPHTKKYCLLDWTRSDRRAGLDWPGGGIDEDESVEAAAMREFTEETGYTDVEVLRTLPSAVSLYYRSGAAAHTKRAVKRIVMLQVNSLAQNGQVGVEAYEKDAYDVGWYTAEEVRAATMDSLNAAIRDLAFNKPIHIGEGVMINSGPYDNRFSEAVREELVADLEAKGAAKERVNYKIRDWLISRQRYWGAPIPMIHCAKCGTVPVPEDQLPVVLPEMQSFEPSGDGRSPLAGVEAFVKVDCPRCGGAAERETDTMDGFACSSWYFLRFADPRNNEKPFAGDRVKQWLPVDDYIGGAEHAVMHLLYARMWTKVMRDAGLIDFDEPFKTLRNQGMILAPDGAKMSKSKGNTIEPGGLIDQGYGADAIRIMELFIGPWNQSAAWSVEGLGGSFRFLQRVWAITQDILEHNANAGDDNHGTTSDLELKRTMHRAIRRVSKDLEGLGFNTAIAGLMETVNELHKLRTSVPMGVYGDTWYWAVKTLNQLLAPFAPHITEELWAQLGAESSIHLSEWPKADEQYLMSDTMRVIVQVNGKLRSQIVLPADASKDQVLEAARADSKIARQLAGQDIKKSIYVPGKLVNFVI
jgi:leucyl-tRNA synthetase